MPTASGSERVFSLEFSVEGMDFAATGDVAGNLKRALQQIGLDPVTVRTPPRKVIFMECILL